VGVVPGLLRTHPARGTHAPPRGPPHTALPPGPTRAAAVLHTGPHRHPALRRPRATSHPTGGHPQPAHPTTGPRLLGDQQVRGVRGVERPPAGPCLRGQFPSRFHLRLVQRTPGRQTVPLLRKQRHTHNTFPLGHTTPRTPAPETRPPARPPAPPPPPPPTPPGPPPPSATGRLLPPATAPPPPPPATPTPGRPDRPTPNGAGPFRKEPRPPRAAPVPQEHRGSGRTPTTDPYDPPEPEKLPSPQGPPYPGRAPTPEAPGTH